MLSNNMYISFSNRNINSNNNLMSPTACLTNHTIFSMTLNYMVWLCIPPRWR